MTAVRLVAAREIRERSRSRAFRVTFVISALALVGATVAPALHDDKPKTYDIALVGRTSAAVEPTVRAAASLVRARAEVSTAGSEAEARRRLRDDRLDIVVVDGRRLVVLRALGGGDDTRMTRLVAVLAQSLGLQAALEDAGLPPTSAVAATSAPPATLDALLPARADPARRVAAFLGVMALFLLIINYGGWVLTGVVEEKSSRVVEVLLCAVRPRQLLLGKALGIGLLALAHSAVLVVITVAARAATGAGVIPGTSPGVLVLTAVWFLLGFALYATLYAAAGSLVSRVEDAQNASGPLLVPIMGGYLAATTVIGGGDPSLLLRVLAYFPLTAPFDMPVLISLGVVEPWQVVVSMGLTLLAIVVAAWAAGIVYARSILSVGRRVRWRDALRSPGV